jgi:endonuclease/exonuclease/phosphatase family metal-dependent hydrolase
MMKRKGFLMQVGERLVRFGWQIVTVVSAVGWALLLVAGFSDRVSPLDHPYVPFFGLFFPLILLFNVVFLCFWLMCRKWKQLLVGVVVLVLAGEAILTSFPVHGKTKELPPGGLKLITYNVMNFGYVDEHSERHPHPILQYVVEQEPDIVCFQEYAPFYRLTVDVIRRALKTMPYSFSGIGDLAVFSRYPILSIERLPIESAFNSACLIELDVEGRRVTLINSHLESNKISPDERNGYYDLTRDPDKQKLENFTHMMFQRLTPAFQMRAKQAEVIDRAVRENRNRYVIVCGDFNDTPVSYAHRTIKGDLRDAFVESGSGMGISFNRYRFLFRIDYILHSKNMKAYNCTVGRSKVSDHYPVCTYLRFLD